MVRVKIFPENRYFPKMLFFRKENILMCLVAFQKMFRKIFSDIWLYSWKYHRKHIFYLLLTFSHIFSVTKRIHNIIHSSKHKQNPEKNHQIRTNKGEITISEIAISIGAIAIGEIAIDADQRGVWIVLSLSLSLRLFAECVLLCSGCVFLSFARAKMISGSTNVNFGQTEIIFRSCQTRGFYGKWFPEMIFSQFKHSLKFDIECLSLLNSTKTEYTYDFLASTSELPTINHKLYKTH